MFCGSYYFNNFNKENITNKNFKTIIITWANKKFWKVVF